MLPLLAACAGNGEGLDANGRPISSAPQPLLPELQSIQDQVFTPICTTCHAGAAAPLGFRLDANSSYAMLVGQPSVEVPSLMRVAPGQPDSSYIIQKLEGHAAVGGQMPLGGPYLPQSTIDVIRQWILDGAQPSAAALWRLDCAADPCACAASRRATDTTAARAARCRGRRARRIAARGGCRHPDSERRRRKLPRRQ